MAKTQKSNSGNGFNEGEVGTEVKQQSEHFNHGAGDNAESETDDTFNPAPKRRPKGKYLASGGDIHEFKEKGDTFVGRYTGRTLVREKDAENGDGKAGDVMGYYFEDPAGLPTVIGNSYQIEKSVKQIKAGDVLYIEFLGKKQLAGKQVNQFDVILLDTPEERAPYGF